MLVTNTHPLNKIAEVTLVFWIIKIVATTLGKTSGDFISQTLNLGYLVRLGVTGALFLAFPAARWFVSASSQRCIIGGPWK